jgi:hypothetical protein
MSWPGCSDQLFSESLLFYVSARRYHYPIDWTGVGLIVSLEREARGRFHEGSLAGFFLVKEKYLQSERLPIVLLLLLRTTMTMFLFCDFSGLASLQLIRMNRVRWLLL